MKTLLILLLLGATLLFVPVGVVQESSTGTRLVRLSSELSSEQTLDAQLEELLAEMDGACEGIFLGDASELTSADALLESVLSLIGDGVRASASFFFLMLGASLALVLVQLFFEGAGESGTALGKALTYSVELVFLSLTVAMLYPHIQASLDAVRSVSDFCEGVLPVFVGVNFLSGMEKSALSSASAFGILLAAVEELIEKIALPALSLLLATSLVPTKGGAILSLGDRLHKLYLSLLGILSTVIATSFALQNAITLGADRAALRALRYGVSSMIPIVGQTVAGTLSALAGGVLYVKSSVGVSALVAIFTLALPPLLRLLLCRLALSLPSLFISAFGEGGDGTLGRLYGVQRRILDTTLALVSLSVALFVFLVILFMKSTVSVF